MHRLITTLTAVGFLAAVSAPAAQAETTVRGCMANSGAVRLVVPNSRGTCPRGSRAVNLYAEHTRVEVAKRRLAQREPGERDLYVRGPFALVLALDEAGVCHIDLVVEPDGLPVSVPGPTGSDSLEEADFPLPILSAGPEDVAGTLIPVEYISTGRVSLRLVEAQLVNFGGAVCLGSIVAKSAFPLQAYYLGR